MAWIEVIIVVVLLGDDSFHHVVGVSTAATGDSGGPIGCDAREESQWPWPMASALVRDDRQHR